jgi:hypothetical protein
MNTTLPASWSQCRSSSRAASVGIVAAGVHPAFDLGLELEVGILLHRQRIHVGAQQDRWPRPGPAKRRQKAGALLAARDLEIDPLQRLEHGGRGLRQVESQLGIRVDLPSQRHGIGQQLPRLRHQLLA